MRSPQAEGSRPRVRREGLNSDGIHEHRRRLPANEAAYHGTGWISVDRAVERISPHLRHRVRPGHEAVRAGSASARHSARGAVAARSRVSPAAQLPASALAEKVALLPRPTSAPSRLRAGRAPSRRSSVKELIATSAATPTRRRTRRGATAGPKRRLSARPWRGRSALPRSCGREVGDERAVGQAQDYAARRAGQVRVVRHQHQRRAPARGSAPPCRSMRDCAPVAASRLPVGSSARRQRGRWLNARASATRCCSRRRRAARGSGGRGRPGPRAPAARPRGPAVLRRARHAAPAEPARSRGAVSVGMSWKRLERRNRHFAERDPRAASSSMLARSVAVQHHARPRAAGPDRPAGQQESRLAAADGPRMARKPPPQVEASRRADGQVVTARGVGLGQALHALNMGQLQRGYAPVPVKCCASS